MHLSYLRLIAWRRTTLVALMVGLGLLLLLSPRLVFAHAQFVRSDPAPNSHISAGKSPTQVQIWFSEEVEPKFSEIQVLDSSGARVDRADSKVASDDPQSLIVSLQPNLPDGTYTVVYRNVSRDDGHAVKSSYSFGIGAAPVLNNPASILAEVKTADETNFNLWSVGIRWLNYLGMIGLVGSLIFRLFVWAPALKQTASKVGSELASADRALQKRMNGILLGSLAVLLLGWLGFVFYQASIASNRNPWEIFSGDTLPNLLFNSRFGVIWLVRLGLIILVGLVFVYRNNFGSFRFPRTVTPHLLPNTEPPRVGPQARPETPAPLETIPVFSSVLMLGLGVGILLTNSLNSHAAASTANLILIPADLLHLLSTGVWVGGLLCFMLAVPIALKELRAGSGDRTRLLATVIPNFSDLAILAVLWLFTTGILQSIVQIGNLDALLNTNYGKALCVKLIIIVPLLGLGGYHNFITSRKLRKFASGKEAGSVAAGSVQRWFRRTIILEVALALTLLVVVGVLTSLGPSRETAIAAPKGPFIVRGQVADIKYTIGVSPAQVGENILEMELLDANGKPITQAQAVLARVSMEGMGDPQELELTSLENKPGIYRTIATVFSMAGNWSTTITIRRAGLDDVLVPLFVPIVFS